MYISLLLLAFCAVTDALYTKSSPVISLDASNFNSVVFKDKNVVLVEFYASFCIHCRNFVPEYEKTAKSLNGVIKVAAIDCEQDSNKQICGQYGIKGFPTIKLFKADKSKNVISGRISKVPEDYNGARSSKQLVNYAISQIPDFVSNLVQTASEKSKINVEEFLKDTSTPRVILFSNKASKPPLLKTIAAEFFQRINVGFIANSQKELLTRFNITTFPSLIIYKTGDSETAIRYEGEMKHAAIEAFLAQFVTGTKKEQKTAEQVYIVKHQEDFQKTCLNRTIGVCFLTFMDDTSPDSVDMKVLLSVKKSIESSSSPFVFIAANGNKNIKAIREFGLSDYLPAAVALNPRLRKYRPFLGAFDDDSVLQFLKDTAKGTGRFFEIRDMPAITS